MLTSKPDNPLDRRIAIMDLYDSGECHGPCTAQEMAERVGGTVRGVTAAFRDLAFVIARRESRRRIPTGKGNRTRAEKVPRQWGCPNQWPASWELRRRLRRMGMSAAAVRQANVTVVPDRYIETAIGEVLLKNDSSPDAIKRRGVYKKALRQAVSEGMLDVVSVSELAAALGEDPKVMTPAALLNRVGGLLRVATRQELKEPQTTNINGRAL